MEAISDTETFLSYRLPMAQYREQHQPPILPTVIYEKLYAEYVPKIPPNAFKEYLPSNMMDGAKHYGKINQWVKK